MTAPRTPTLAKSVPLKKFFRHATRDIHIHCAPDLFVPDEWTSTFAHGLQKLARQVGGLEKSMVLEIGVGTGVNMAGLLSAKKPVGRYVGTDISAHAVRASLKLANAQNWSVILKQSDLLNEVPNEVLTSAHHIVACIPQVPVPALDLQKADNAAHYYPPTGSPWDQYGLGLNAKLLSQASEQAQQATVTLNLAGRPGLDRLKNLFKEFGYGTPQVTHQKMVQQHAGTSLKSLADMEINGHEPFEFFADERGRKPLNAHQAEARRYYQIPVYHKIYVLTGPAQQ